MNTIARALLRKFRLELLTLILISAVVNLLMLLPTIYMLQIFDRIMISKSELTLLFVSLIVLALYGIQALGEHFRSRITSAVSVRVDQALSPPIFQALFQERLRASSLNPLQAFSDLTALRHWMTGPGLNGFLDGPWTPFYLAVMFMLHPMLGWLAVGVLTFLIGFAIWSTRFTKDLTESTIEEERDLNNFLYTKLRNAEVLEAHGMVPNLKRRWWEKQLGFLKGQAHAEDVQERLNAGTKQIRYLLNSLALGAGALLAIEGEITLGAMIAASLLMGRTTAPVDALMGGWRGFAMAQSALDRLEQLLKDNPPGEAQGNDPRLDGSVRIRHLSAFAPQDQKGEQGRAILTNINLEFPLGEVTVVLGPSGAGKSTLGKVLVGIWPQCEGECWYGDQRREDLNREALGQALGYLPQEVDLFRCTVAENIARLGSPDPTKVIAAATAVGIHDFLLRLPQGYDTVIGDQSGYLSGGQRQRVALARALYGDPKLLVLDEPNASLDEAGEAALLQAVRAARARGATVVLISHRPSVLQVADRVLYLKAGRVGFSGTRDQFVEQIQKAQAGRALT